MKVPIFNPRLLAQGDTSDVPAAELIVPFLSNEAVSQGSTAGLGQPDGNGAPQPVALPVASYSLKTVPQIFPDAQLDVPDLSPFDSDLARASAIGKVTYVIPFAEGALDEWFFERHPSARTALGYFGPGLASYGFTRAAVLMRSPHLYGYLSGSYLTVQQKMASPGGKVQAEALRALIASPKHRAYVSDAYGSGERPLDRELWTAPTAYPDGLQSVTNTIDSAGVMYRALWGDSKIAVDRAGKMAKSAKGAAEAVYSKDSAIYKKVAGFEGLLEVLSVLTSVGDILDTGITDEDRVIVRYELLCSWHKAANTGNRSKYLACLATAVGLKYGQPTAATLASLADAPMPCMQMAQLVLAEFCFGLKTIYHYYK